MDMIYQYEPTYISYYQTYDPNIYETQQYLNPFTDRLLLATTFSDMLLHLTTAQGSASVYTARGVNAVQCLHQFQRKMTETE